MGGKVYNAVEPNADFSFRQIDKPSGRGVHYKKVVDSICKIDNADIVKGYEVDTGQIGHFSGRTAKRKYFN